MTSKWSHSCAVYAWKCFVRLGSYKTSDVITYCSH